jgi:hypothetical protein
MKTLSCGCLITVVALRLAAGDAAAPVMPLYQNDFSKAEVGKMPDEFLVLEGQFAVKQEGDNQFLELPGAPLDTFGALFGPSEKDGLAVSARIFATGKGRRFPTFAVSLNGVSGYRLQVAPAKSQVELLKGDQILTSAPYRWESGCWTHLKLQLRKVQDGGWQVAGKVWSEGAKEPDSWKISLAVATEPTPGRPGIWGSPFSGTPIRFDDLKISPASEHP